MTRARVVHQAGAAWLAAVAGAWLVAVACRTIQVGAASDTEMGTSVARAAPETVAPPSIRVGILPDVEGVAIDAVSGVTVRGRAPGETAFRRRSLPRATFRPSEAAGRIRLVETGDELALATVTPARPLEPLRADASPYRGVLEVRPAGPGRITVVNAVNVEDYLRGVVPNELSPQEFPRIEALKAQAVAARTYALAHLGDHAARGYDVCATAACQVYRGLQSELPLSDRAVAQTRGIVATWRGRPINAYYTSACGGHTEDGAPIFDDDAPYLRGVACRSEAASGGTLRATADRDSRDNSWAVRLTPKDVERSIARYGSVGRVTDLQPKRLGVSGRVVEMAVVGSEGQLDLTGLRVRFGLGLRESLFVVSREMGPRGAVAGFVITGRGFGHGVGLCQIGAYGMAREGSTYEEILRHYYTGIRLSQLPLGSLGSSFDTRRTPS